MKNVKTFEGFIEDFKRQWKRDVTGTLSEPIWIHINIYNNVHVFMDHTFPNKPNSVLMNVLSNKFDINYHGGHVARFESDKVDAICEFLESIGLEKNVFNKGKDSKEIIFKGKLSIKDLKSLSN